jgi:triphosphoribosyl-dephospho-CoA synthetase
MPAEASAANAQNADAAMEKVIEKRNIRENFEMTLTDFMDLAPPSCVSIDSGDPALPEWERNAVALGALAALATYEEVMLSPKPGLVCPDSSGSHSDMNWVTFLVGASAIAPLWRVQALAGLCCGHYKPSMVELADKLRAAGKKMECAMFEATGGINTHKGLIFALSLLVAAAGTRVPSGEYSPEAVFETAGSIIASGADRDFRAIVRKGERGEEMTHGEKIYFTYGIGGIRAEAANAFPSVRAGLSALEEALSEGAAFRDAAIKAMLTIMSVCEDTNVIHRAGVDFWRGEYRDRVSGALRSFDPMCPGCYEPLRGLGNRLIELGASPGGAADLLACTLFMYRGKISDNNLIKKRRRKIK